MDPSSSRRRRVGRDDEPLEEGEFVPRGYYSSASESDTDDDVEDNGYYSLHSRCGEEIHPQSSRFHRLEDILAVGRDAAALPSPTPSGECESDGTISDDSPSSAGGVAAPAMRPVYTCHVCGKGFGSPKAVAGHMRVHDPRGRVVAVDATGKRGWTAGGSKGKSVLSSSAEEPSHSMDDAVLQPMPLSFARSNPSSSLSMASAKSNLDSGENSSRPKSVHNELVVVPPVVNNNPSTETVVHPPPPPAQQADPHQIAPAVPPPAAAAAAQGHHQAPAPPRREYTCKLCGASYPTHQGLGGHAAGHRNRQKEAAAAGIAQDGSAAAARGGGNRKVHACDKCDRVFPTGMALGGHKRKHWDGGPIVQNRKKKQAAAPPPVSPSLATPAVCMAADLTFGLGIKSAGQTSVSPSAPGRVRLFGIDIGLPPQAPAAQQGTDTSRQAEEAPAVQDEEGSAMTEDSAAAGGQRQDEKVEKSSTDSPSKESSN